MRAATSSFEGRRWSGQRGAERHWSRWLWLLILCAAGAVHAQTCQSPLDMDASVVAAVKRAATRYFDMAAKGNVAGLKQNSIPAVAADFKGIEDAVKENQTSFSAGKSMVRPPYLLIAESTEPLSHVEFLCGIFSKTGQTKDSAVFVFNDLPPGKYGVAIIDVNGDKSAKTLTLILQEVGEDWKLAGFFARPAQAAGHDSEWFAQRAQDFKQKGQKHNAWLFYREAISLAAPVDFMSTQVTDELYDESHAVQPVDLPGRGNNIDLNAGGKVYHLTDMFPLAIEGDFDVVVKYRAADVSDTAKTFEENTAVIKALVAKYPEFRQAFDGVIARAVEPSGRDYGTLLATKEIK